MNKVLFTLVTSLASFSMAMAQTSSLVINEVQSANVDQYLDPSYNYGGWIEIYNPGSQNVYATALYLTDDKTDLTKWPLKNLDLTSNNFSKCGYNYTPYRKTSSQIAAKGYCTVWFDHLDWRYPMMASFKLDCDGGSIYLTDGSAIISQVDYPESISRCSYARTSDGGDTWQWCSKPTPGSSNSSNGTSCFASTRLAMPTSTQASRIIYNSSVSFTVSAPSGAILAYTTDGSTPGYNNTSSVQVASGTVSLSASTSSVYRFVALRDGYLPSAVLTLSFIKPQYSQTLPIMSLVTEQGNLDDSSYGIMVQGSGNGRPGRGQYNRCNWNMDWDRPSNMELFNTSGECVWSQEANIAICGGWSRAYEPHSFKIKGKKQYENTSYLQYPFFSNKPYIKNKTLQMRNGGNDNPAFGGTGRIKDAALQSVILSSGLNIDGQSLQPVQMYHNGKYAGLMNMREPNNKDYVYSNYGYDDTDVDQFEMDCDSLYVQSSGDKVAFNNLYTAAKNGNMTSVNQLLDIEEFFNYMAVQSFMNMADFGYNNMKGFRPRTDTGRFRFILFDLDSSASSDTNFRTSDTTATHNDQYEGHNGAQGEKSTTEEHETFVIWQNILKNSSTLKKQFIDQFCILNGSVFNPTRAKHICDSLLNIVSTAASQEKALTGQNLQPSSIISTLESSYFSSNRISSAISGLQNNNTFSSQASYSSQMTLTLSENNQNGRLYINNLPIPTNAFSGTVFSPVTIKAEAPAGYKFLGWKGTTDSSDTDPSVEGKSVFAMGSSWKYNDQGQDLGTAWYAASYDDSSWSEGAAPLGYSSSKSDGGIFPWSSWGQTTTTYATTLSYGTDSDNKYPCYYFRKTVTMPDASKLKAVTLNVNVDDGVCVFVNGKAAGYYNMSSNNPSYSDYSSKTVSQTYESNTFSLDKSLFQSGSNLIALEVHNCSTNSSDIYLDASLSYTENEETPDPSGEYLSTNPEYTLSNSSQTLEAVYAEMTDEEKASTDVHPIKINEVSAANSIYINDHQKKDDWLELYNTTSEDIDLEGYYLSDDLEEPEKFQFTKSNGANTIIPAHGFKLVWCAKKRSQTGTSALYAPFNLGNDDGDCVILTAPDKSWCDTLTYKKMNGDETCGLYPNGGSDTYIMNITTPDKSNQYTLIALSQWYDEHSLEPEPQTSTSVKYVNQSNQLSINRLADNILVRNEDFESVRVTLTTLSGTVVLATSLDMSDGTNSVNISSLPNGIFIATATNSDGNSVSIKFTK